MKNKIAFIYLFCFFFIFVVAILAENPYIIEDLQLNPFDYARITDVDYKAVVVDEPDSRGKVVITERLTFDIHAASEDNLFWELWRDLPEDYVDGLKVEYKVNSVKQIYPDGSEVVYEESPVLYWEDYDYISPTLGPGKWYHSEGPYNEDAARYECVFFYVDGLYREEVVFEIEYEMYNAALRYNDCSDLYLALYSESTINHLESYKAQILFPNEDMPSPGNYEVYTYGTNANEFPIYESADLNPGYHTFFFELDEEDLQFKSYNEYIEFDLVSYGEDRHIFTEYAPSNYYSSDDVLEEIYEEQQEYANTPAKYRTAKFIVFFLLAGGSVLVLGYAFTTDNRMKTKHYFFQPTMQMDYYRDIPSDLDPNFAASLAFCKHKPPKDDSGVYSAILLSLARKKYIDVQELSYENIQINIIKKEPPKPTPPIAPTNMGQTASGYFGLSTSDFGAQVTSSYMEQAVPPDIPHTEPTDTPEVPEEIYEPLTPCEEYYFNLIVRHATNNTISMNTLKNRISSDYSYTDAFVRNMDNSIVNIGVRERYFQKADYAQPRKQILSSAKTLQVIGILCLTLVNIISYMTRMDLAFGGYFIFGISCLISWIYLKLQAPKYVLLTQFGEDEYQKWRGLYNFLNSDTLIHERTVVELPIWEKYLVYATAFGLSEKIIKAISINCPEAAYSPVLSNHCYRSPKFHRSSRSFRHRAHSSASIARGGGGFGYGGGGRGGGGGGGGH